jgi:hypothetical protein
MKPVLVAAALAGFAALGCETGSDSGSPSVYYGTSPNQVRVVAPDGRTFVGDAALAQVFPRGTFTFDMNAGVAVTDPVGQFGVAIDQPVDSMVNPELIELAINSVPVGNDEAAVAVGNEKARIHSGLVHLELRAGRMTGWAETPVGTYTIEGLHSFQCFKPTGDHAVPDEGFETPLCQRFASLRVPNQ